MENKKHTKHEPLFHIVKRGQKKIVRSWVVRFTAILLAVVLSGLIAFMVARISPVKFFSTLVTGSFGSSRKIWKFLQSAAILLGISVAITPAFRMRFWNTGAEGQALVGGLAAAAVMQFCTNVPTVPLILLIVISGIAAGALWGLLPAVCKAKWNTNETLFTLMMNYIAIQITSFFVYTWDKSGHGNLGIINRKTKIGWLPSFFGNEYAIPIIFVLIITYGIFIYLSFRKHGYEISVVGESVNTARYVGINVTKVIIRTMVLSGALCGLMGALVVSGVDHTISRDTIGGQGFTAIMVSWMSGFNPFYMIFSSLLIIFLERGGAEVSTVLGLNASFSQIISGLIIFFIIGSEFFVNYKVVFNHRKRHAKVVKDAGKEES